MPKKVLVAGGDLRQYYCAKQLASLGFYVSLLGFDELAGTLDTTDIRLTSVPISHDILVLPPLSSTDSRTLYAPHDTETYELSYLMQNLSADGCLLHGVFSHGRPIAFETLARSVRVISYDADEPYAVKNAFLTAEGALSLAVTETDTALAGSLCLIRGCGRIGKALMRPLLTLGARVCVLSENAGKRIWCTHEGMRAITKDELPDVLPETDFIFNTAPQIMFDDTLLPHFGRHCTYIELASSPFGIDFSAAAAAGVRTVRGGGLPGRFSPRTAGKIEADTVMRLTLREEYSS